MIKAILFDLDGTLVDRQASLEPFVQSQYERCISMSGSVGFVAFHDRYLELDACGYTPRLQLYETIVTEFSVNLKADELVADFRAHIGTHSVIFPGTREVLMQLRTDGYKLGIVTNGSIESQSGKIRTCQLDDLVDTVLISAQEGIKKPAPEIYLRAAKRVSAEPANCLFVGDNPRVDVQGAQAVGMQTVWQKGCLPWPDDLSTHPDFTTERITELLSILHGNNP